jgi:hypothetical protein
MNIWNPAKLRALYHRWEVAAPRERANAQPYVMELCEALGVGQPQPAGSGYEFEFPVRVVDRADGLEAWNYIDLYKSGHFVLEAKQIESSRPNELLLQRAFGQAQAYARALPGDPPPYLLVLDIPRTIIVWDRWQGTYGSYATGKRINLADLCNRDEDSTFLRTIWENPESLDPRIRATQVTEEIARKLAELARKLEGRGYESERVARFMIRCVFTMFAEDTQLLPKRFFQMAIESGLTSPADFVENVESLWRAMDKGEKFYFQRLLRFNGHFFHQSEALPLRPDDLALLLTAAKATWRYVEPAIFGTLLTRALDPAERHRLGAEYTPRAHVEQVIRATIEEPVRGWWTPVQAEVMQLCDPSGKTLKKQQLDQKTAVNKLREFHGRLRAIQVLDPACGSGNFLYLALHCLKRIEREVLLTIEQISGQRDLEVEGVNPSQFHGIEVKSWAREIAELTLWIGFHQAWTEHYPGTFPPEPLLKETGTLERRDAVLVWDRIEEDPSRSRPDPTLRLTHPVTGRLVPDPTARLRYDVHCNARPTQWPAAHFIVGNPPYLGQARQREAFGDGYVDALRAAYPEIPDSADYVMYWWYRAAELVASDNVICAGLITTNSIVQPQNRPVIERAAQKGARISWAVADHPWIDESGAADVRVAMTVVSKEPEIAILAEVDENGRITTEVTTQRLNADLTAHADVAHASASALRANSGLASPGFKLHGPGFILAANEAEALRRADPKCTRLVRRFVNGRDLAARNRGLYVIDLGLFEEHQARQCPMLYDVLRTRVKPERDANARATYARYWWRFGESRRELRAALSGLSRYIATPETAKHRFFVFLDKEVAPDNSVVCIATDNSFHLGVLSSTIHVTWAIAAGGRLGIGNDPRYTKTRCFDPFPFPDCSPDLRSRIGGLAEHIDAHRRQSFACDPSLTLTNLYNVVEKLRTGESLSVAERWTHDLGACGVLLDLHNQLDAAVAEAYGWEWPLKKDDLLDRLVELHDLRIEEESKEQVLWLRPDYQTAESLFPAAPIRPAFSGADDEAPLQPPTWPMETSGQIETLLYELAKGPISVEEALSRFQGADLEALVRHLEALSWMGEVRKGPDNRYYATRKHGRHVATYPRNVRVSSARWPSTSSRDKAAVSRG